MYVSFTTSSLPPGPSSTVGAVPGTGTAGNANCRSLDSFDHIDVNVHSASEFIETADRNGNKTVSPHM